jgi:alpha-glucosidase (family GH31 glycosyl hydrolase)
LQAFSTTLFLINKGERPFILSRSTTIGFNQFGYHWTGDNYADFEYLKISIANNFMFQIWGINMVGADICGFSGNTN